MNQFIMRVSNLLISIAELFHYYMYVESYKTMNLDKIYVYIITIPIAYILLNIHCTHFSYSAVIGLLKYLIPSTAILL